MNRDKGQYHLSHIFDELLISPSRKSPKEKGKSTGNSKIGVGFYTSVSHLSSSVDKDNSDYRNVHK